MRRRFRQDILVRNLPAPPESYRKKFKYESGLTPFNIWFREQLKKCGGLKAFCRESKIKYPTAKCWTYGTNPQTNSIYDIAMYFGSKFGVDYRQIVADIENLKLKKGTDKVLNICSKPKKGRSTEEAQISR
tara:strand:+ start:1201 stop:1593 length:393 start_codon:yes stop_codon:yes gene_type:complete